MVEVSSNVKGELEHFQRNEDLTFKIKILGEDGQFHIYDKLTRACKSSMYEIGDYIGEAEELNYTVRKNSLNYIK